MLPLHELAASLKRKRSKLKPKDEMKRCGWSTAEQDEFLIEYLPQYKDAQASQKFEALWKEVDNAFNEKWPPEDVGEQKKVCMFSLVDIGVSKMLHRICTPGLTTKEEQDPQRAS